MYKDSDTIRKDIPNFPTVRGRIPDTSDRLHIPAQSTADRPRMPKNKLAKVQYIH